MLRESAHQPGRLDRLPPRRRPAAPFLALGLVYGMADITLPITAFAGISERDAGVDAGLINTSQQARAALGLAVVATIADGGVAVRLAAAGLTPPCSGMPRRGPTIVPSRSCPDLLALLVTPRGTSLRTLPDPQGRTRQAAPAAARNLRKEPTWQLSGCTATPSTRPTWRS
jgi:hypothetical protein